MFKEYQRTAIAEMRPVTESDIVNFNRNGRIPVSIEDNEHSVFISDVCKASGSPKIGDMITRNSSNHLEQRLVPADYFTEHFQTNKANGKTKAIYGLGKLPSEALSQAVKRQLANDQAEIKKLNKIIAGLQIENKTISNQVWYLENSPNTLIHQLKCQLHKALEGTEIDRQTVKEQLYQDALLQDLVNYKAKATVLVSKMREELRRAKDRYKELVEKHIALSREVECKNGAL